MKTMTIRTAGLTPVRLSARAMRLGLCLIVACGLVPPPGAHAVDPTPAAAVRQKTFKTPEEASEALIQAAENGDAATMAEIFGPDGMDLVASGDPVHDKNRAAEFAAVARTKTRVLRDPEDPNVATLVVGSDDWPLPIPIVKNGGNWRFDTEAGRQEILYRRIGENELDAIEVCRGFVEAQHEYAFKKRGGVKVNQYAQNIVSTPGTQDGLAWQASDGSWQGPVGEAIAQVIAEGYAERFKPYHGYYFKVLKGQGPSAPMGEMDFMVGGIMIGGFALVAAPADYAVTGVMTFIVSHDGVVYEKALGPTTLEQFRAMERYDPDPTWNPVSEP
jgi:hypothetical protein